MLVADTFNAVRAKTILDQRRALQRLARHNLAVWKLLLQIITSRNRARRTRVAHKTSICVASTQRSPQHLFQCPTSHCVMPQVVAHLLKLIKDHQIRSRFPQLIAFVKNFLHIAFRTRRLNNFTRHGFQPLKALGTHAFRQNSHRLAAKQRRVVGSSAAVVSG